MTEELSPSEAAARIGATTRSVQRWISSGRLPARRVGGRWRVASDALAPFLALPAVPVAGSVQAARRGIRTLFVANRGEIAARIERTCRRLGIATLLAERDAPAELDLLHVDRVVEAAASLGADAVHPGYGFLAENPDFAEAVAQAGLRWVGPPPAAIQAMGDKSAARRLAASLAVPIVPGYDGDDQADATLAAAAERIGYPIVVKPAAGGGGKGMRVVRDPVRLADALGAARREARAAFGSERLILERFLEGPRHVEVQVLFDSTGHGVHLGERDCSIQRRHQKILEEAPSPAVTPEIRQRLGDAALRLAGAVGYVSAGTVEFLLDDRGSFYFLEMNTRLQVEHPVTELVTGRDLVADQLRIAGGGALDVDQAAIRLDGHAVEVRLYAEDAEAGFLPATGRVERLRWGAVDRDLRVDAGIEEGDEVGDRFDPLLAKVIARGRDRAAALQRLAAGLDETLVLGLVTNLRFLRWLVRQPVVRAGEARIDTLDRIWPPDGWAERAGPPDEAWAAAAARLLESWAASPGGDPFGGGWRLNAPARVRLVADVGTERPVDAGAKAAHRLPASVRAVDGTIHVDVAGRSVGFRPAPPPDVDRAARAAAGHGAAGSSTILAPMPGAVLAVHVEAGAAVEAGDPILTLEAMKMEHVVPAPVPGTVAELAVRPADQVTRGQRLAVIEA